MSKEIKIALMAIVVLGTTIWGYNFLLGQNILTRTTTLYAEYEFLGELEVASPVYINGFKSGVVTDIHLKESDMHTIVVVFNLETGISVPKNAIAEVYVTSVMGGKALRLVFDKSCAEGSPCAVEGDKINSRVIGLMPSLIDPVDMNGYMTILENGVGQIMDTLSLRVNDPNDPNNLRRTYQDMQVTIANLKAVSAQLNNVVGASSGKITGIISNLESISSSLKGSNKQIASILGNVDSFSNNLTEVDLKATMKSAENAISSMKVTLTSTDTAIVQLNDLLAGLKRGEGSLGQLITNDSLYNNLNESLQHVRWLSQDIRLNPKRYTTILRKRATPYTYPQGDPALEAQKLKN